MQSKLSQFLFVAFCILVYSCNSGKKEGRTAIYHGTYNAGPEVKTFKDCDNGHEFWAADSSASLELQYSQLNIEKPYIPVYVEVEGITVLSGKEGKGSEYDSTLIVKKVLKITKEIPLDECN